MREMSKTDYSVASALIGKITRSARQIFDTACKEGQLIRGLISDDGEAHGVATLIETKTYWACYLSFVEDIEEEGILLELDQLVAKGIKGRGEKSFYLNIYGANPTLISHFHNQDFKENMKGYQFRYQASQGVPTADEIAEILERLEVRRFEEEKADFYLEVDDEAFKALDLLLGYEPYGSKRHREEVIAGLKRRDERNEFVAFWLDDDLVGDAVIHSDYLNHIAVHPKYQSQGWGTDMLRYCIYYMIEKLNFQEIFLNCLEINEKGLHYYKKNNFQVIGYFSENTYQPEGK